ncbi:hypothetical protein HQ533_05700 [Candidatus Woesearchaeota archaeon]|nr:hypothetical protein [Candidatus Woesearchaeota archaeon]
MVDDYELLPHEELEALRREVQHLKKSPYPDSKQNKNLLDTMDDLNTSINKLIKIFEGAQEDIIKEYSESSPTQILKQISEQNAKIAEGIVALADLVKGGPPRGMPKLPTAPIPGTTPNIPPSDLGKPMPGPPKLGDDFKLPDLDEKPKKKGLFGKK